MATNKEIVESAYASFAAGDVPAVLGAMDPKIEWNEAEGFPIYSGTVIGPDAVLQDVFMRLGEIGDEFSVNPTQFIADGDTVVVLGVYAWKHKASGRPAEVKMCTCGPSPTGSSLDSSRRRHREGARAHRLSRYYFLSKPSYSSKSKSSWISLFP